MVNKLRPRNTLYVGSKFTAIFPHHHPGSSIEGLTYFKKIIGGGGKTRRLGALICIHSLYSKKTSITFSYEMSEKYFSMAPIFPKKIEVHIFSFKPFFFHLILKIFLFDVEMPVRVCVVGILRVKYLLLFSLENIFFFLI